MQSAKCFCPGIKRAQKEELFKGQKPVLFNGRLSYAPGAGEDVDVLKEQNTGLILGFSPRGVVAPKSLLPAAVVAFYALFTSGASPAGALIRAALGTSRPVDAAFYDKNLTDPAYRENNVEALAAATLPGDVIAWGFERFAVVSENVDVAKRLVALAKDVLKERPGVEPFILAYAGGSYSATVAGPMVGGVWGLASPGGLKQRLLESLG